MKLIECVPNFSEGRNKSTINKIVKSIQSIDLVEILDVEIGFDTNRTVITFVGPPNAVIDAAYEAIKTASLFIDMKNHKGTHSRIGATDVCPIVPISDISISECIKLSKNLAEKVGDLLKIPVYLYEYSAIKKDRQNLANIRKGEYELLPEKINSKKWKPDFGPDKMNYKSGATVIGVRNLLIAYNVNLNTNDVKIATDIALDIRELGRNKRDKKGKFIRDKDGIPIKKPGIFKYVKAVGWKLDEFNIAQISINLTNHLKTPLHLVYHEIQKQARKRGFRVTGSEIIGVIPKSTLIDAGKFFIDKQKKSIGIPEKDIMHIAVRTLGLNDLHVFDLNKKIIENAIKNNKNQLLDLSIKEFLDELSSNSPCPGGGSASALTGSLAASLISMVCILSTGKKKYDQNLDLMSKIGSESQIIKDKFNLLVDLDNEAFSHVMNAFRLPNKTKEEKDLRLVKIESAYKLAIATPLNMLNLCLKLSQLTIKILDKINLNTISDLSVSLDLIKASTNGAFANILINLKELDDIKYKNRILKESNNIKNNTFDFCNKQIKMINKILNESN